MNKELFERYAALKIQEKQVEEELKELKPAVLESVLNAGDDAKVNLQGVGTFSITTRKYWKYTPSTVQLEKDLKETKKDEEASGAASFDEASTVMFKAYKPEKDE